MSVWLSAWSDVCGCEQMSCEQAATEPLRSSAKIGIADWTGQRAAKCFALSGVWCANSKAFGSTLKTSTVPDRGSRRQE